VEKNRGVALILALLVLSFLTVLGGALLTASTIDIWISDNYKSATQVLYLAEAGIDHARHVLLASGRTPTESLQVSAGADRLLSTNDDQALVPPGPLEDGSGRNLGSYEVWLRNDDADGSTSITDSNDVLTVVSTGRIGSAQKTMEVTIEKGKFPENTADPRLHTVAGLESLAGSIMRNATELYDGAAWSDFGSAADYRVAVASGNVDLGPGVGYGLLLVRGELHIVGDLIWNGLILVIGQGVVHWNAGVTGTIDGGLFVAKTRALDSSLLGAPSNWSYTITDVSQIQAANRRFPFNPIAIRER
jgi:Tfp pilus assembly protein PilX